MSARVLQDSDGQYSPWFELLPEKFTCAKDWAAAVERQKREPGGLYTDKPLRYIETLYQGAVVDVTSEHRSGPKKHDLKDFCFHCAPDELLEPAVGAALDGKPHAGPTIHWQVPESFCPRVGGESGVQ